MTKSLSISTLLAFILISSAAAYAETTAAPCGSFKKLSDGRWSVAKQIKIEHGNESALLNPGTIIAPGTRVAGADIYAGSATGLPDNESCELAQRAVMIIVQDSGRSPVCAIFPLVAKAGCGQQR